MVHPSSLSAKTSKEIEHLLAYVAGSNCQFNRNGDWYESIEAAHHIERKYNYVLKKGVIKTAEDFIRYSASESRFSGKKYTVQCPNQDAQFSDEWLIQELQSYRHTMSN